MSPSASNFVTHNFVVVGNPESRRIALFQDALARMHLPAACVVSYLDLLQNRVALPDVVRRGDIVRLESPGQNWEVEKALLHLGAREDESEDWLSAREVEKLQFERGRIWPSRQWFCGLKNLLQKLEYQLAQCAPHRATHNAREIALMFDKPLCHAALCESGVAVPRSLGSPRCFEELAARMREHGCGRVFIKLAHGAGASGIVAYRTYGRRHQATTTVEMIRNSGVLFLYNSRRVRVYDDLKTIAELIDALCRQSVHVEEWLPKIAVGGKVCDARVVVIAGRAQHAVLRLSQTPMTNLHLLNARGDITMLQAKLPPRSWDAGMQSCESAMRLFPKSLCGGVDILWTPDGRRHAILEVNAWGDFLPGALHENRDSYEAQIAALQENL